MRVFLLTILLIVSVLMSAQTSSQGDPQIDLQKLASLLKQGAVGKIKVLHVHDSTLTRVAVSKEAFAFHRKFHSRPQRSSCGEV